MSKNADILDDDGDINYEIEKEEGKNSYLVVEESPQKRFKRVYIITSTIRLSESDPIR